MLCRSPLSDVSAGAVVLLAFWALARFGLGGPLATGAVGAALLERAFDRGVASRLVALGTAAMIVGSILGIPRQEGRLAIDGAFDMRPLDVPSPHYALVQHLDRAARGQPALVLTAFNPVYISAISRARHVVLPLSRTYQPSREPLVVSAEDRDRHLRDAIALNRPVFLLIAHGPVDTLQVAPLPAGYAWGDVYASGPLRLARLAPARHAVE